MIQIPLNTRKAGSRRHSAIFLRIWFVFFCFLSACTAKNVAADTIDPIPTFTESPETTVEVTEVLQTSQAVSTIVQPPTPAVCADKKGRIVDIEVPNKILSYPLKVKVYLPPCYTLHPKKPYPYVIMIHGMLYKYDQWDRVGADEAADELISSGEVPPFLILMPFEEQSTANPYEDGFGEALTKSLIPFMEENYPVCAERSCRAIGGLSRGAGWAIHIGLSEPEYFGEIGAHSLPPFIGDLAAAPRWLAKMSKNEIPRVYIDIGIGDSGMVQASQFEQILTAYNIPHEWHINNGEHTEDYWSAHVKEYMRWYASGWNEPTPPVILN
ncbi:alpha/beta hydrolase [Leptolinea tardivitalis]|uniref:Esterase n=1 Tax=Leptolinea tardivitalis TaxID=229920 RepID=A0A0P6XJ83_9CHLR|nr:alpha/beta hydrolase-fold protein [Leptolinea tardivitalis]KPL75072.1 hypothetical protein ADM99_00120 [Leptolinea tardivitalis]GAP20463.1 enterochelin esterase [Leptolinea tardivitalis]